MAGSVQQRGENRFLLTVSSGIDGQGKRIRKTKTITARSEAAARKELALFMAEVENGQFVAPSHIRFKNYVEVWKRDALKRLAPKTIETYQYVLDARILPYFSHYKLENITHIHINKFIETMEKAELSSSTIQKHYNVLSNIFNLAVRNETIKKSPMKKVNKPVVRYKEGQVYNSTELKQLHLLLNKEENTQMVLLVKLALMTGMRKGELLALQWQDIDFSTNTIHVRHSLSYTKANGYQLKEPKTKGSNRKVAPPRKLMDELKKHKFIKSTERMEASELWEGGKHFYVFSSDFGKPLFPSVPNRWWTRFINRVNKDLEQNKEPLLKKIRFHDLRHVAATDLINKGANIHSISKRLGHSSIKITLNIYGHYLEEADQKIADMLDEDYI